MLILRRAERVRNAAQHVGHVGVGDRQAIGRLARHRRVGEVDRVLQVAVLEVIAQLVDHHHRGVVLGLAGRGAEVGQRDHARERRAAPRWESR